MSAMICAQAASAAALILVARRSSLYGFGSFISLYGVAITVGGVIDFGSSSLWSRELARGASVEGYWPRLATRTLFALAPVGALTLGAFGLFQARLPPWCIAGLSLQALTIGVSNGTGAAVRALDVPARAEWFVATGNVTLLATVALSPRSDVLQNAGIAACASWLVTGFIGFSFLYRRTKAKKCPRLTRSNPWEGCRHFGVTSVAVLLSGFIIPMVGAVAGSEAAASLGAVAKWSQPISLIAISAATFLTPRLARAESDHAAAQVLRQAAPAAFLGLLVSLAIIIAAPSLVAVLLGGTYRESVYLVRLSCLAAVPVLVGQPAASFLQARGYERSVSRTYLFCGVSSLVATVALAALIGASAVPLVSLLISSVLAVWCVRAVSNALRQ